MRPVPALLVALTCCGPALAPPPPARGPVRPPVQVRVATWNVHDLFDAVDRTIPPGDEDFVPSAAEVEEKVARIAEVLARVDADAWLLQEVESREVLDLLARAAGYPAARLVEGNDPRGIDVALLSRLPVAAYASHAGETGPDGRLLWPRDCVEAWLDAGGGRRLVLVGSHLSSALSDDGTRRAWQAARLRAIADAAAAEDPAALVLAGGDLNDAPASDALAPLLGDGAWRDPVAPGAITWAGDAGAARLDYLLLPAASGALVAATVDAAPDVALASDHRPVVLDLHLR